MSETVGMIGLGVLGSAIAMHLAKAADGVIGFDIDEAACNRAARDGVIIAGSIGEVAEKASIVITCVPSSASLQAVLSASDGLCSVRHDGQLVVEMSTLAVAEKEAARDVCEAAGDRRMLDCPVSGNRSMALKMGLTAFASGTPEDYARAEGVLGRFCGKVHYVGGFGAGTKTKLAGNILNLVHNAVAAEVMVLAMKSGLDPAVFHDVISGSGSSSAMFENRGALMVADDYEAEGQNFSIPMKDAPAITGHAAAYDCPVPIYQVALQQYRAAVAQGLGHLDPAAVCRSAERAANFDRKQAMNAGRGSSSTE